MPVKIAIIEKNRKRAGDDGKREKALFHSSLFPLPIMPRALLIFLPSLPTARRGLCGGERLGYVPEYTRKKNSRKRNQIFSISFSTQNKVKKAVLQFRVLPNYSLSKRYHVSDLKMYRKNPALANIKQIRLELFCEKTFNYTLFKFRYY